MADRVGLYAVADADYRCFAADLAGLSALERLLHRQYRLPLRYAAAFHVSNYLIHADPSIAMFGRLLARAIYGGSLMPEHFTHPVFPPRSLDAQAVADLYTDIRTIWDDMRDKAHTLCVDPFWNFEISRLLEAYGYAAGHQCGLVVLTPAYDHGQTKHPRMVRRTQT